MKDTRVRFNLYGVSFESRPLEAATAQEMIRQLADRDVKDATLVPVTPRVMYMILGVDRGEGYHRIDTAGLQVWPDPEVAREEMRRWMFSTGHAVVPVEVCHDPRSLGTAEQQEEWKRRKK